MADEVYQENIYQSKRPFTSCKKVSLRIKSRQSQRHALVPSVSTSLGAYFSCKYINYKPETREKTLSAALLGASSVGDSQKLAFPFCPDLLLIVLTCDAYHWLIRHV